MTLLIAVAFAVILGALLLAGVFMIRGKDGASSSGRMMRALAVRIGVSVAAVSFKKNAWRLGWIHPSGIPLGK